MVRGGYIFLMFPLFCWTFQTLCVDFDASINSLVSSSGCGSNFKRHLNNVKVHEFLSHILVLEAVLI